MVEGPAAPLAPAWASLAEEPLLDVRLCDLDLRIDGTDEWYSPGGVPGVAVPFYLLHPRLAKLELAQMLDVEGDDEATCLEILRHDAGHAIDALSRLLHAATLQRERRPAPRLLVGAEPTGQELRGNLRHLALRWQPESLT